METGQEKLPVLTPLTPSQEKDASFLLGKCGLEEHAERVIQMHGLSVTVRQGFGLCFDRLADDTPEELRIKILAKLEEQEHTLPLDPLHK